MVDTSKNLNILNEETLLRRVSTSNPDMWAEDKLTHERRVTSAAFVPQEDGLSVYRKVILENYNLHPKDIILNTNQAVLGIKVQEVKNCKGLEVQNDPWPKGIPEEDHLRNAAHALIVGWDSLSRSDRKKYQRFLAKQACLVDAT